MSDASYIFGTVEYLFLEVSTTTPGVTLAAADWTAHVALVALGAALDDDAEPSIWSDASLETVAGVVYARVLMGSVITPAVGQYRAYVRLTKKTGGTEIPLLRALGVVSVVAG